MGCDMSRCATRGRSASPRPLLGSALLVHARAGVSRTDLIVHLMQSMSGTYVTVPMLALKLGESTSGGTGMKISTPLAEDLGLNCERALTLQVAERRGREVPACQHRGQKLARG